MKTQIDAGCKIDVRLSFRKENSNVFLTSLSTNLLLEKPIKPDSDELIQDIAVHIRSLKNDLNNTLEEITQ